MIIVDGNKSSKSISTFENLEQVLTDIMQDDCLEGRVITDVLVNRKPFRRSIRIRLKISPAIPFLP